MKNALLEKIVDEHVLTTESKNRIIYKALLTRKMEELLLRLYSEGELHGTIHTCIGQEFSGAVISEFLKSGDAIFSNHRCHGHFLSVTQDYSGLLAEIYGKRDGVCGGKGGSQHLCRAGFYSNGIQGGIAPVTAGLALARKINQQQNISMAFIGDGTLGQGVLYETFNLCSKWKLPIVFILENNLYAQSTHQAEVMAGNICARAKAFDIYTEQADTWDWEKLYEVAGKVIRYTRSQSVPSFLQIDTYRLKAHSKGDDTRALEEINYYLSIDPLNLLLDDYCYIEKMLDQQLEEALERVKVSDCNDHYLTSLTPLKYRLYESSDTNLRLGTAINETLKQIMAENEKVYFLGEDIKSPYGGAFKISHGLSDLYPERVLNTPISESAIVGTGIGLAMEGFKPIVEIMFGDFITLAMDQIINHAAKFRYMYNEQVRVPLMIRVPMGGGRGYGPTHSQTLDRHLFGIPGLRVIAINNLIHPKMVYQSLLNSSEDPTIVIENKVLYTAYLRISPPPGFSYKIISDSFPIIIVAPESQDIDVDIISYGGLSELSMEIICTLFSEHDLIAQLICPIQIYPFNISECFEQIHSKVIVIIEEGQGYAGFGAEILAQIYSLCEMNALPIPRITRIYADESVIPASRILEMKVLPEKNKIIKSILQFMKKEAVETD